MAGVQNGLTSGPRSEHPTFPVKQAFAGPLSRAPLSVRLYS